MASVGARAIYSAWRERVQRRPRAHKRALPTEERHRRPSRHYEVRRPRTNARQHAIARAPCDEISNEPRLAVRCQRISGYRIVPREHAAHRGRRISELRDEYGATDGGFDRNRHLLERLQ